MSNLRALALSGNDFDNIPSEVGSMTSLQDLVLTNNVFSGSIPSLMSSLQIFMHRSMRLLARYRPKLVCCTS